MWFLKKIKRAHIMCPFFIFLDFMLNIILKISF